MFRTQQQQQQQQEKPKQPNPFNEKATGIIIIYPTLMIHVVEVFVIINWRIMELNLRFYYKKSHHWKP